MKQRKGLNKVILLAFSVIVSIVSFSKGQEVSFQLQWPLYEALRNTSAIVFAVMGAWIAIIYPADLKNLSSPKSEGKENVFNMLQAMSISALVLAFVLIVAWSVPIMKQFAVLHTYTKLLRGISYSLVSLLTLAQLWTILLTILPNYLVKRSLIEREVRAKFIAEMEGKKFKK